jgi:hypothetical protein
MRKLIVWSSLILGVILLNGCSGSATVGGANRVLSAAVSVNDTTGRLMRVTGPTVVAVYCIVQPPNCSAATTAYKLALAAQTEYAAVLGDMQLANAEPDGAKLITLASTFWKHFNVLTQLTGIEATNDVSEFQKNLGSLQAEASK